MPFQSSPFLVWAAFPGSYSPLCKCTHTNNGKVQAKLAEGLPTSPIPFDKSMILSQGNKERN